MSKRKIIDAFIMCLIMILAGCLDPEGSVGQFFLDSDVQENVNTGSGIVGLFGPVGATVGSATAGLYAIGRSYFTSKKAKGEKDTALDEAKRLQAAFEGLVDGVQKTKDKMTPEQKAALKEELAEHTPDWVREVVHEVKNKSQKYLPSQGA